MEGYGDAFTELKEFCSAVADLNARLEDRNRTVPVPFCGNRFQFRVGRTGVTSASADRIKIARGAKGIDVQLYVRHVLKCGGMGSSHRGAVDGKFQWIYDATSSRRISSQSDLCCKGCWVWLRILWRLHPDLHSASPNRDGEGSRVPRHYQRQGFHVTSRNNDDEQYIRELTAARFSNTPEKCSRGVGHFEHSPHLSFLVHPHSLVDPDSSHMLTHFGSRSHGS